MSWFRHFYAPRKRAATIHSVYIADGLADDCEELITRCCQAGTLNFYIFSNIWNDMNFALIFQCRSSGAELAELSEEALLVARRYLIQDTTNFEETVASLFLVYALLNLQPLKGFAALRLIPEDLEAIFRIEDTARQQQRHDVLYVLASVLIKGPCQFHVAEREYGMDTGARKYFDTVTSIDKYGTRPKGVFYRQTEELDLLRELSSLGRRYARAKIFDDKGMPDKTLRYTDEHLPNELAASLKQLIDGETGSKNHAVVQSIKERAMWNTIQEMRHLKRLPERQRQRGKKVRRDSLSSSPTKSNTKNSSPTKSGSPKKPLPTSKKKVTKHKSRSLISSTDDDSEISLASITEIETDGNDYVNDDDDCLDTNCDTEDDEIEIPLCNLKTIEEYINAAKTSVKSDNTQPSTSNSNFQYEIEIIDYMNDNNAELKDNDTKTNKPQRIAAVKAKQNVNKSVKSFTSKNTKNAEGIENKEEKDYEEVEAIKIRPTRNTVIKKTPDFGSLRERGSKGTRKSSKCETATASENTHEALGLPNLVLEVEYDKDNNAATDAVEANSTPIGKRRSRRLSIRSGCNQKV